MSFGDTGQYHQYERWFSAKNGLKKYNHTHKTYIDEKRREKTKHLILLLALLPITILTGESYSFSHTHTQKRKTFKNY